MIRLNSIENELKKFDYDGIYNINLRKVVDDIYNELVSDKMFVEQIGQKLNSKSTLYDVYKEKLEDIVIDLIDIEKGYFTIYNILTSDAYFYDKWRIELFELIYIKH